MMVLSICPNCGIQNKHRIEMRNPVDTVREVKLCYPEDGGCDTHYVVEVKGSVTVDSYKMMKGEKIE